MTQQEACRLKSQGCFSDKSSALRRVFTGYSQPAGTPRRNQPHPRPRYPGLKRPVSFFASKARKSLNTKGLGLDEAPADDLAPDIGPQIESRLPVSN